MQETKGGWGGRGRGGSSDGMGGLYFLVGIFFYIFVVCSDVGGGWFGVNSYTEVE